MRIIKDRLNQIAEKAGFTGPKRRFIIGSHDNVIVEGVPGTRVIIGRNRVVVLDRTVGKNIVIGNNTVIAAGKKILGE